MSRFNAAAILAGMGSAIVASQEDNDLNININADHEGDGESGEDIGSADFDNAPVETVEPEVGVVEDEAISDDTSGVPETAELDVNESGGEVAQVADQIEDANDVATGLESLIVQLATISQEGIEVTPFLANSLRTQYDFVTRKYPKLRVDADGNNVVPSVESWTVSQEDDTESFMGKSIAKLRGAGQAILKFLRDLWEKIKALFGSLAASSTLMRKKAQSLKARKVDGSKAITLPAILTSAPFNAASIDAITALVKAIGNSKLNAGMLAEKGWGSATFLTSIKGAVKPGVYLGNFTVEMGATPVVKSAEASKVKDVRLTSSDVGGILNSVIGLADAIENYKREENLRKVVNEKLIKILQEEVKPQDASRYAKWQKARETAKMWGKYAAFEGKLIGKAVAVGNAANNAVASATIKA